MRRFVTRRTIAVRSLMGNRQVRAWCFGEWAVHANVDVPDRYVLTLMPLGLCMPPDWCWFGDVQAALRAAVAFQRLRNDWAVVTQSDLTLALKEQLRAIARRCGSGQGPSALTIDADLTVDGREAPRLNGYAGAA